MEFQLLKFVILYSFLIVTNNASSIGFQESGASILAVGDKTNEISGLYDYQTGTILYKDVSGGVCLTENLGNGGLTVENSVIIPGKIPYLLEPNTLLEEIINSTLAKAFCGQLPIYGVPNLLHPFPGEISLADLNPESLQRPKRSIGNGNGNRHPGQYWPQQGSASQTQIQGQVTGQGFFSGQAQSQQSGASQSQVQLSGAGILGSVSSSAGNAQAQIALAAGGGSGQAGSSGVGPSNSQVQVNLGQEGRGSMASASVQGGPFSGHGGDGKPGWIPGNRGGAHTGYSGNGNQQALSHSPGQNNYGFGQGAELGYAQGQPQTHIPSPAGFPGHQQNYGQYDSGQSRSYDGQSTGGSAQRNGIDQIGQIFPPQTSSNGQASYQNGLQVGSRAYPGASLPGYDRQTGVNGLPTQFSNGNQLNPVAPNTLDLSKQLGTGGQQLTNGYTGQLGGTGNIKPLGSSNGNSAYSNHQVGDLQLSGNVNIRDRLNGGSHAYPDASKVYQNGSPQGSNRQASTYQGDPYSQHRAGTTNTGSGLPQAFASSYGGGQAQAQTVYLGPGTSAFYSPGKVSYGSSAHPGNGGGNGNGRSQTQYVSYDSGANQGRSTSNGYRSNGYRQTTTYTNGHAGIPSTNGYRDQTRSPPDGFVQPYVTSNGNNGQAQRPSGSNGYSSPSVQIQSKPSVNNGNSGQTGASSSTHTGNGLTPSIGSGYSGIDQTLGSTVTKPGVTIGQVPTDRFQPDSDLGQRPAPSQSPQSTYQQQPTIPVVYPGSQQGPSLQQTYPLPSSSVGYPAQGLQGHNQPPVYTPPSSPNGYSGQESHGQGQPQGYPPFSSPDGYSGQGLQGQSHPQVYQPASNQVGYPGTISNFLQRPQEQDGFSASYGISHGSQHDNGSQRCTIITFTCTIIMESNGRAKICRPNLGQANGSNGNGASAAQAKPTNGGICCC